MAVPAAKEVTCPVELTFATEPVLLLQLPPAGVQLRVFVIPIHPESKPVIPVGVAFTVIILAERQDPPITYETETVPVATPVTMPLEPTVAIPALEVAHVPPGVEFVKLIEEPTHTLPDPEIADGAEETVTIVDVDADPMV